MKKYDFDKIIERQNTDSFKWDMNMEYFGTEDILPMWVADMDFQCADPIVNAIKKRAEHPIFGYTVRKDHFLNAVLGWLKKRHSCQIPKEWLTFAPPGVIYAIHVMLNIVTSPGDKVLINMPNYDPLFDLIVKGGRQLLTSPLICRDGVFEFDFKALEKILQNEKPKVFILSSPHNPTGRVWTQDELKMVSKLCVENNVYMIVDEIHADFVSKNVGHVAFATLGEDVAKQSMICYSANKGFNLGGLQMCSLIIADETKRKLFDDEMMIAQTRLDTSFGEVATETAYSNSECEEWLDQAIEYVDKNKQFAEDFLKDNCKKIRFIKSEGTYLCWLDCSELKLESTELESFMINEAKVGFSWGYEFGEEGKSFVRMNLACPKSLVKQGLEQLVSAVNRLL